MLEEITLFIAVVQLGSFQAAADKNGLSPATLTRRIQKLEQSLRCQLLSRSARGVKLTPAGQRLYDDCALQVMELSQQLARFEADATEIKGRIRMLAPINLAQNILQPLMGRFLVDHPGVQLSLQLSNNVEPLAQKRADLAIRVGAMPDSNLRRKRLGEVRTILVASPETASNLPKDAPPDLLNDLPIVSSLSEERMVLFHEQSGESRELSIEPLFFANDLTVATAMLPVTRGVMLCPISEALSKLQSGELCRVLPQWRGEIRPVYAVWNEQNLLLPRSRALLDFLGEALREIPELQGG